ncbi:TetR/AcrR family transcriptional regulator C-terminal domain-containing protein [Streptomyces niveus]|uniref:TetR/AcrR family transcriptional regulator C-terminal domain-containing protein n=1 Tax=Streptomyces niveus TaxID=193462 RepID=UPI0020D27C49|nr:TetR/AcrR family transcriptional regulator C-terminal domain-containing protein [Streptomyces niveus]
MLNHAGDPYLGGKLIDWALIERLLVPAAVSQLGLTDLRRDNPKWRGNFAKLKRAAEDAKIHLSRRDLYELMVDLVADEHELPERPTGDWRADLTGLAHGSRAIMRRHPWMSRLMSAAYGFSPNSMKFLEYSLWCLDPLDLPYGQKVELVAMVNGVVTTYVANEIETAERTRSLPWSAEREQEIRTAHLAKELATGRYPRLAAAVAADSGPVDMEAVFDRALSRVLDSFARG